MLKDRFALALLGETQLTESTSGLIVTTLQKMRDELHTHTHTTLDMYLE